MNSNLFVNFVAQPRCNGCSSVRLHRKNMMRWLRLRDKKRSSMPVNRIAKSNEKCGSHFHFNIRTKWAPSIATLLIFDGWTADMAQAAMGNASAIALMHSNLQRITIEESERCGPLHNAIVRLFLIAEQLLHGDLIALLFYIFAVCTVHNAHVSIGCS